MATTRARLRLLHLDWPTPAVVLADTPRPNCPECDGTGSVEHGWMTEDGDADVTWGACDCFDPLRVHRLLPVPAWLLRLARLFRPKPAGYSDESPF